MCTYATGNLHFVKFETSKIGQCLDFIKSKNLHHCPDNGQGKKPQMRVQATGGGAFKYADMFQVTTSLHQLLAQYQRHCEAQILQGMMQ